MKILVSNDDSVYSEGIALLEQQLSTIAEVDVIAPFRNFSGASHSLTLQNPIRTRYLHNGYISVEGTPTDCVHVGVLGLLDYTPDYVVSGVNHGANLGEDVLYSGTVAAAMEATLLGIPSIAISLVSESRNYLATAAMVAKELVKYLDSQGNRDFSLLNVNVPAIPYEEIQGFQVTRLGRRHHAANCIKDVDPRGLPIMWVGPPGEEADAGPGSDFHAIANNKVSITPIKVDITDYASLKNTTDMFNNFLI